MSVCASCDRVAFKSEVVLDVGRANAEAVIVGVDLVGVVFGVGDGADCGVESIGEGDAIEDVMLPPLNEPTNPTGPPAPKLTGWPEIMAFSAARCEE